MKISRRFTMSLGTPPMRALRRSMFGVVAAVTVASATAGAQVFSPTGTNTTAGVDNRWNVLCTPGTMPAVGQPSCPTGTNSAVVVTASPSGWQPVPTTDGASYISVFKSGSIWPGAGTENPHYQYVFSTDFTLANSANSVAMFNLFAFDNYWVGGTLNTKPITISPNPAPPNGGNWTGIFQLTAANGLSSTGNNHLELTIQGNGVTDGILVDKYAETTPEPSSMALLGTGLIGLVPLIRRKKQK